MIHWTNLIWVLIFAAIFVWAIWILKQGDDDFMSTRFVLWVIVLIAVLLIFGGIYLW